MAAATPLPNSNLIPTSYMASSAVEIAPNIIVLLRSPKCPILNNLSATLIYPPPKDVLYLLYAVFTMSVESIPSGTIIAVTVFEYKEGSLAHKFNPHA